MTDELREMLDHHRIRKVLADYCRGCDRVDEPRMAGVYAADSWDDHGAIRAPGPDFTRQMCGMVAATTETLSHLLGQSQIMVDGDEAGAETYFIAVARMTDADGQPSCNQLGGRFVDRLVREAAGWRVRERTVLRDWSVAIPLHADWTSTLTLRPGLRSGDDPSYAALGQRHAHATAPARA